VRLSICAAVLVAALLAPAPAAFAHAGNPNFLSEVDTVTPRTPGVTVDVINRDDRLLLHNTSGKDVEILGYQEEPYARVDADGTVEVNTRSTAYYLNDDRFGQVNIPKGATGGAPAWKVESKTGRFEWHDHRFHWMNQSIPPQVKDKDVRTKVLDWKIPITIGGTTGNIGGQLFWTPRDTGGGPPLGAIFGLAAVLIASCVVVFVSRRRRGGDDGDGGSGTGGRDTRGEGGRSEAAEVW
jgi:hypothetical protein